MGDQKRHLRWLKKLIKKVNFNVNYYNNKCMQNEQNQVQEIIQKTTQNQKQTQSKQKVLSKTKSFAEPNKKRGKPPVWRVVLISRGGTSADQVQRKRHWHGSQPIIYGDGAHNRVNCDDLIADLHWKSRGFQTSKGFIMISSTLNCASKGIGSQQICFNGVWRLAQ